MIKRDNNDRRSQRIKCVPATPVTTPTAGTTATTGGEVGMDPLVAGTSVSDAELKELFGEEDNTSKLENVTIFGQVDLDNNERALLAKRPEFAVFDCVDKKRLQEEFNVALCKVRWDRRSRDWLLEEGESEKDWSESEREARMGQELLEKQEDAEARLVYNEETDVVDLGSRRATDMKHNTRLHMPQPRPPGEEAVLGARQEIWMRATTDFMKDNCMPGGVQRENNLSTEERVGLASLKRRVKSGELTILPSDKGNKFTVSSIESYERQGDIHTTNDRLISEMELDQIQARMNNLSRGLAKITGIGSNWGIKNEIRCKNNLITDASIAPLLYPSPKTHKELDQAGDPKSRPIVQASSCVTSRPGELLADVIEAALLSFPNQQECQSTEEMLAKIDSANKVIQSEAVDVCVGSADVVGLYPSLEHLESAKLCGELILMCPASFKNIDVKAAAIFVATNCSEKEIKSAGLTRVVPARRFKFGPKPTAATGELKRNPKPRTGDDGEPVKIESKFLPVRQDISQVDQRKLLAKVVEVGVLKVIRNHVYRWKDQLWLQSLGVPTGLRLSGLIGRVTMDHWRGRMLDLLKVHEVKSYIVEKYVDDVEAVCENMELGTRWTGDSLSITPETALQDKEAGRNRDEVTMVAWGQMASSILPSLDFTVDYCSRNKDGSVPMLDFHLWKESQEDPDSPGKMRETLRYSFFEKSMANKEVMNKHSAMPHTTKMSTLT